MSEQKNRIYFKKMEITNCGRYYDGPHTLDFDDPEGKNITVIVGDSGTGKSTIHNLIYWCLYGEFKPKKRVAENEGAYGLINTDKLESLALGEEVTGTVSLTINNEKGELYYLTRSLTAKYHKELKGREFNSLNNSEVKKGMEFISEQRMFSKNESGQREPNNDNFIIKNRISSIFPQELSDFFLFDGENLEKFEYASTATGYVKSGIEKISGLGVLDRLSKIAEVTGDKLFNYVNGKSATSSGLNATYTTQKNQVEVLKNRIGKNKEDLEKMEQKHEQYIIRLDQLKDGKLLNEQLDTEKSLKQELEKDRIQIRHDIHDLMFKNIPNLLAKETFQNCEKIFGKLEDEDKIPPAISRKAIDKILASDPLMCVCGRTFSKDDESWNKLEITKKGIINESALNALVDGADLVGRMLTSVMDEDGISKTLSELTTARYDKTLLVESQDGKILDIERRVGKVDDDKGEDLGSKKNELSSKINDLQFIIKNDQYELEEKTSKRDNTKLDLDKKRQKETQYQIQNHKIDILKSIVEFTKQQRDVIVDELRKETQDSTNRYFKKSVAQADSFDKLIINPKFQITARDRRGLVADVSKGQGHVLGLSYVAGVRDITEVKTSLIIDSPLHNISSESRNNMAKALAENLPGVQLILLVTDTEYTQSKGTAKPVQDILKPTGNVSREYEIKTKRIDDPSEPGEKIEVHYFGEL